MNATAPRELEPWTFRVPAWSAPLLVLTGIIMLGLGGVLGIGLLLVMSPVILTARAIKLIRDRNNGGADRGTWPPRPRGTRAAPQVIEGEYEVVDESTPRTPEDPRRETLSRGPEIPS